MEYLQNLIANNDNKNLRFIMYAGGLSFMGYVVHKMFKRSENTLRNKLVLITGASGGLGKELARQFLNCGCMVILAGRNIDKLNEAKQDLINGQDSCPVVTYELDPGDIERLPVCVEGLPDYVTTSLKLKEFTLDILVNNAGISQRTDFVDTSMSAHNKVFDVNYFGPVFLTQLLLPHMLSSDKPTIVNICSLQSWISMPGRCAYSASKFALRAFGDSLRNEMGDRIRVLSVYPGYIATNLDANALRKNGEHSSKPENQRKMLSTQDVAGRIIRCLTGSSNETDLMIYNDIFQRLAVVMSYLHPGVLHHYLLRRHQKKQ